ncbi:MAG: PEGA domain-containing protein [Kofleriaceae bacterium]
MKSRLLFVGCAVLCASVLALGGRAHGQSADALKQAQAAFDQAQIDYLQGKFDEAAKGFQDAFAARPFPQFLYNVGASYHMKGKKTSDATSYQQAVEYYKKYLNADPQAADKAKVEKAIGVLELEIKRLKDSPQPAGAGSAAPAAAPSQEVEQLGDVKVRGLVVIESEPQNATVYLDDKKKGPFATTPWSGSIEGAHKVIIEKRGYKIAEGTISADPSKLFVFKTVMAQEDYLGWVEITSNVPGADIYIDDKSIGAIGKTPLSQNIKPGKHTFWISTEGYNEYKEEVEVIAGSTHAVRAQLSGSPVGKLNVIGMGIEDSTIYVDGKVACEIGPCLKAIPQGDHTITVTRPGFKPYTRTVKIQAKTEMSVKVSLAPKPSRSDAITAYVLAAGFTAGGIVCGLQSKKRLDALKTEIAAGNPPPDPNDKRFDHGKWWAWGANGAFALAGVTALAAVWYTFRDKGPPSTALLDVRSLALQPEIGPGYAGLGMGMQW